MDKSNSTVATSSADVEVEISEAEETIETIDTETVEKKPSIDETKEAIGNIREALLRSSEICGCPCCDHHTSANQYLHNFLIDMTEYEGEKYRQLGRYFSRVEKN